MHVQSMLSLQDREATSTLEEPSSINAVEFVQRICVEGHAPINERDLPPTVTELLRRKTPGASRMVSPTGAAMLTAKCSRQLLACESQAPAAVPFGDANKVAP
jgi:hypothetical protein